jgi:hypothetical protein
MRDKMKSFILANAFSVIMFIMCILLIFLTDYLAIGIGFSVLWLIYTIFANKAVLSGEKKKPIRETFHESNRKGLFNNEVKRLETQYDSIKSREEYMMKASDSMQDLYQKILEQAESNLDSAAAYMESYDYYTKPEPTYLRQLVRDGDILVQRFNTLVEKLVDIDTNPTTLDMKYVDDVTDLLEELQEHRQVMTS